MSAAGAVAVTAGGLPAADDALLSRLRAEAPAVMDHPSGFLSLSHRNRFFTMPGQQGFVAYRERGKHLVAFGGVQAPAEARERLLDAFLAEAKARRRRVMVVQLRESHNHTRTRERVAQRSIVEGGAAGAMCHVTFPRGLRARACYHRRECY